MIALRSIVSAMDIQKKKATTDLEVIAIIGHKSSKSMCIAAVLMMVHALSGCSQKVQKAHPAKAIRSLSTTYNHFDGGVLFADVVEGLDVLWEASFKNGHDLYKENVAFFVPGGLLILPNAENTRRTARLSALQHYVDDGKLFVRFGGHSLEVLGIIHTHPDVFSLHEPAPRNDYSYCYLGIHNYVMDHLYLMDAYKDRFGRETFAILGQRKIYTRMPFAIVQNETSISLAVGKSIYTTTSYTLDSLSLRNPVSIN